MDPCMEPNQSEALYSLLYNEREECWYVTAADTRRVQLSKASLQQLVSMYNQIYRGNPLTLIPRRAMEELGEERRELHETVRHLYDYIDTETTPGDDAASLLDLSAQSSWWRRLCSLLARPWSRARR